MVLYVIQEYKPAPEGDYVEGIIAAEHTTLKEAQEDAAFWNEANPQCGYAIVKVTA